MKPQIQKPQISNQGDKKKWQKPKAIEPQHQEFITKVGEKLKAIRIEKELSISEAAKRYCIPRSLCYQLEGGKVYFTISTLLNVLDKLDISASDFFHDL